MKGILAPGLLLLAASGQAVKAAAASVGPSDAMVRIDLGCPGSVVQPGWLPWPVGPGAHWDRLGPFEIRVPPTAFDADGFRVVLGPDRGIGYRSGPECSGPYAGVIAENVFTWADRPMQIVFRGLAAGLYRITTWHNDSRGYVRPPLTLLVTDSRGRDRVAVHSQPQTGSDQSERAARARFTVAADGVRDVVVDTRVPVRPHVYVSVNGIEIAGGDAVYRATHPVPQPGARGVGRALALSWEPGVEATAHTVLLGAAPSSLRVAAVEQSGTSFTPGAERLPLGTTVYWRVDETRAGGKAEGALWSFTTHDGRAHHPSPPDKAHGLPRGPTLSWAAGRGATAHTVWVGAAPAAMTCVSQRQENTRFTLTGLPLGEKRYWRVDEHHPGGTLAKGDTWSFTVKRGEARHPFPGDWRTGVDPCTLLAWAPGADEARHSVYLGSSVEQLRRVADALEDASFRPPPLPLGTRWFWRVDEQYAGGTVEGDVWSLTVAEAMVLDDMESYAESLPAGGRATDLWIDGRADPTNGSRVSLASGRGRHLVLAYQLGEDDGAGRTASVHRHFVPPLPVAAVGANTLALRIRGRPDNSRVDLCVLLEDHMGARRSCPVASDDLVSRPTWQRWEWRLDGEGAHVPTALRGIELLLESGTGPHTGDRQGTLEVDDIHLLRSDRGDGGTDASGAEEYRVGMIADIAGVHLPAYARTEASAAPDPLDLRADVCVVGGGSGGIGAAIAAARAGADVVVIEREERLGGTSTQAYVSSWEPGPGCTIAREIYDRLQHYPNAVSAHPPYEKTLTRASNGRVGFEPGPFAAVVTAMLEETGRCRVLLRTTFVSARVHGPGKRVVSVHAVTADGAHLRVQAGVFIDCTGGAYLCQAAGCETMLGAEPSARFGEPSAPAVPGDVLNALELCYRIRPSANPCRQPMPSPPIQRRGGYASPMPGGDKFVNPCGGLLPGWFLVEHGYEKTMQEARRRAQAHWHWMQEAKLPGYEFDSFAPMLAIRESYRIVGEYVLTENDLTAGLEKQAHDDIIAVADHPMDTHGQGGGLSVVRAPYGIPFRCLVPKGGWRNLLIACRGASFSHLAASSCRLSRTMIQLGHAAGLAAAQATQTRVDVRDVEVRAIRRELGLEP